MVNSRYIPSQADVLVFKTIASEPSTSTNPHVARWYTHIKSYAKEHDSLPGSSTAGQAFLGTAPTPTAQADEEEDIDLFGSDEEDDDEAEKLKQQRIAEYNAKKANKPKTIAKVRFVLSALPIQSEAHG